MVSLKAFIWAVSSHYQTAATEKKKEKKNELKVVEKEKPTLYTFGFIL